MTRKKGTLVAAAVIVSLMIAAAYFVSPFLRGRAELHLSRTAGVFATLIMEHRSVSFLLKPELKIRLDAPDTLVLDNSLFRMTAYCDSMLMIVNQVERQLLIVNNKGEILNVIGRTGAGPGEFMDITCIAVSPRRSLYLYDHILERFTVFDLNGRLLKIFRLRTSGIPIRHIAIDKSQMILVHHPPSKEYPAFISVFDSNGTFVKNLRGGVDWGYNNYYLRGFLDGDLMITNDGDVVESDDFSYRIYVGDMMDRFKGVGGKPSGYEDPPTIENGSPAEFMKTLQKLALPLFFFSYNDSVIFQEYVSAENKTRGSTGVFRAIDLSGNYLGEMAIDRNLSLFPNLGDPSFLISVVPRMEDGRWNQRTPFDFVIYRWKTLDELLSDSTQSVPLDTARGIGTLKELGSLVNIKAIGFVSQRDCETCVEVLISELNQLKLRLRDKGRSVVLAVINSDKQFSQELAARYGGVLEIVPIASPVSLTSPSVYLNSNGAFEHLTIESTESGLLGFTHRMDSVITIQR